MVRPDPRLLHAFDVDTQKVSDTQKPDRRWPAGGLGKDLG